MYRSQSGSEAHQILYPMAGQENIPDKKRQFRLLGSA
jgi:hypothetical protein